MAAGLPADPNAFRIERDLPRDRVRRPRAEQGEGRHRDQSETDEIEERQREDVERGVASDQRIGLAERRRLQVLEQQQPLTRGHAADEERAEGGNDQGQQAQVPAFEHDGLQVAAPGEEHVRTRGALYGQPQVPPHDEERDEERGGAEEPPGGEALEEDALVLHFTEPEPFNVEVGQRRQRDEEDQRRQRDRESRRHEWVSFPNTNAAVRPAGTGSRRPSIAAAAPLAAQPVAGVRTVPRPRSLAED